MAFSEEEKEFLRHLSASVIIPIDPDTPVQEILEAQSDVAQRSHLFFDERVKLYLVLDFPACPEDELKAYLKRLELKVEAWAVAPQGAEKRQFPNNEATRELIASNDVTEADDPITLVKQDDDDSDLSLQLIWEVYLTLHRPRLRIIDPSVEFVPTAIVSPQATSIDQEEYLEPFSSLESNILGSLKNIPGLRAQPYFPASRLEKVLPAPPKEDIRICLGYTASDLIRIYPAVIARLKYIKLNTHTPFPATIASLDIEMIPFVEIDGSIDKAQVSMCEGKVTALTDGFLPICCRSKDCITLIYDLQATQTPAGGTSGSSPIQAVSSATNTIAVLSISLLISVKLSESFKARITMDWTTNVDFSQALNPSFGPPSQPIQRTKRPESLPFGSGDPRTMPKSSISSLQSGPPRPVGAPLTTEVLSISFIAPENPARVGVPFSWRVLIVNRSQKPVRLAIVPLPRIQRASGSIQHYAKRHAPKASISSVQTADRQPKAKHHTNTDFARAVMDENVLYALQHSGAVPPETDLVSLTAELRVGPLSVGQCHESEIRFIAFKTGAFTVDAVRVVDLAREADEGVGAPGVINDIRELPDIIVVENSHEIENSMKQLQLEGVLDE